MWKKHEVSNMMAKALRRLFGIPGRIYGGVPEFWTAVVGADILGAGTTELILGLVCVFILPKNL